MINLRSLSKRGTDPYALPLIITSFLALFIAYIMWVQPQERLCFLGFCNGIEEIKTNLNTSQTFEIGFIGGTEKETLETFSIKTIEINDLPNSDILVNKNDFNLKSNFFLSKSKKFEIKNFDLNSDFMRIKFKLSSFTGNPSVKLIVNNIPFYLGTNYENEMQIPTTNLTEDNTIKIVCQYHGLAFWQTQTCNIEDFEILSDYYDSFNKIDEKEFFIESPENIGSLELNFYVENSTQNKNLNISINNFPVFFNTLTPSKSVKVNEDVGNLINAVKLKNSNTISFEAEKDSNFVLKDVLINFRAKEISSQSKTINFEVTSEQAEKNATFILNITDVVLPGIIDFTLYPSHITIEKSVENEGILSVNINSKYINEGINNVKMDSPNGRFKIKDIRIILG